MKSLVQLKKELEELENREFMIQMADHLDSSDYKFLDELHRKIREKKEEIADAEMRVFGLGGI